VEYVQQRSNLRVLERSFGCKALGGASRNTIIFRASDAAAPFVTRNVELLDLLAPQFEEQLREYKEEDSFIELVRRAIQDRLTGQRPSIDVIAQALHMSPRALQRRLQESGPGFQRVLDEARHLMARDHFSNSVLEFNEAAYLLGFETRTRSAVPFATGKVCRQAIGVKLIAFLLQLTRIGLSKIMRALDLAFIFQP
jgi:AraC-like DNA-binding protein